jgi:hypothetical protein
MAIQQLTIPMFHLGILLLPGETKTLHIFEDRYKELISDCLLNDAHFGIPFSQNKVIGKYGIEVKLVKVIKTYENGELDVLIEGLRIFTLVEYFDVLKPKLYGAGLVLFSEVIRETPSLKLQDLIKDYIWTTQNNSLPIDAFDNSTLYSVARLLDLSNKEKLELVSFTSNFEKENYLMQKIRLFTFILNAEANLKEKFVLN